MAPPSISVVVPARNAAAALPALLDSLGQQTLPVHEFELIVVDNGSHDSTAAVAARAGAHVVREGWANRARARNRGAAVARAPLLAFTDADCVAAPGWLAGLVQCLQRAVLVAGPVQLLTSASPGSWEALDASWRFDQERNIDAHGWAASANIGMRADAFAAIGGFDPAYRAIGEDVDLCLRAHRGGTEIEYCPQALVSHAAETRPGPILRRAFRHGWSSNQHHHRLAREAGWRYWRHPAPILKGDWALTRFGLDPARDRRLRAAARAEYAARVAGSAWAELRRAR